mmetsp:Transcript_29165/g.93361  ORF Transcript_29165/g.93361 Transcript_29165/m.93361 type:complete len:188 (-) Transcript_29165:157-720(-)
MRSSGSTPTPTLRRSCAPAGSRSSRTLPSPRSSPKTGANATFLVAPLTLYSWTAKKVHFRGRRSSTSTRSLALALTLTLTLTPTITRTLRCLFLDKKSKALIVTDFWWNWPDKADYPDLPLGTRLWRFGMDQIYLPFYKRFMVTDKERLEERMQQVEAWDFDTILPCHGFVLTENPKQRFRSFYPNN